MTNAAACPKCGDQVDPDSRYCPNCGTDTTDPQDHAETAILSMADLENQLLEFLKLDTIGQYEILDELGRGGMAMVYLGHDINLNRKVAIKVMSPALGADKNMQERFIREAQTAASLSHPNVIPVYAVKQTDQMSYFVMKFIKGRPLDSVMEALGPMPSKMVATIIAQVAGGLDAGHKKGIVHRDVKPANIMLDEDGWAIVTDFGIAKVTDEASLTQTGAAIGTPTYMSPEQLTAGEVNGQSDQYSLGIMAYEMLSGRKPFDGDSVMTIMLKHMNEAPEPFIDEFPECPAEMHDAIMKMIEKKQVDRFLDMGEVINAFGATPLSHDDPVRLEMITLATEGLSAQVLDRIRTPLTPVTARARTGEPTPPPGFRPSAATIPTGQAALEIPPESKKKRKVWPMVGIGGALAVTATVLALAPWNSAAPPEQTIQESVTAIEQVARGIGGTLLLSPAEAQVEVGQAITLQAAGTDSEGNAISGSAVTWESLDAGIATVSASGVVTGLATGVAKIMASFGGQTTESAVTVIAQPVAPPPVVVRGDDRPQARMSVASVQVSPQSGTVTVGQSLRFSASAVDGNGRGLSGRRIQWQSSNPMVASVQGGLVIGVSVGNATISAISENRAGDIAIVVSAVPVFRVSVAVATTNVPVGQSVRASADLFAADGSPLLGRTVRWNSSNTTVASVAESGLVVAIGPGAVTITASSEGRSGSVTLTVPAPEIDDEQLIAESVQKYARALESKDLEQVRAVYPRITGSEEDGWAAAWRTMRDLRVTLRIDQLDVAGSTATLGVSGSYAYQDGGEQNLDVVVRITMEKRAGEWLVMSVR